MPRMRQVIAASVVLASSVGLWGCGEDFDCCTLRLVCEVCACDKNEKHIIENGDGEACKRYLDEGTIGCAAYDEQDARADCS